MKIINKIVLLFATLLSLGACQPSHISLIRIDTIDLQEVMKLSDPNGSSLTEIQSILNEVCEQFKISPDNSNAEIQYSRYWGSANKQHPNSIYLSLNHNDQYKNILEISIFEWDAIKHTEFGQNFLAQLLKELKTFVPEQEISVENL